MNQKIQMYLINSQRRKTLLRRQGRDGSQKIFTVQGLSGRKVLLVGYDKRFSPRDLQITKSADAPAEAVNIPQAET